MSHNDEQLPLPPTAASEDPAADAPPAEPSLDDLVSGLATAKAAEKLAEAERIRMEELVAEKVGGPESGQRTYTLEDGTKVTVTRGFNYKADCQAIQKLFRVKQFDSPAPVASKATLKLDEKGYKWYAETHPSIYRAIAKHVTATPKKIAVVLKAPKS
jgi:hypothetical protein